ncbi:hypothetical protein WICPIJ_000883 [Wickerhamomyces pijperi]|uniref:Uncharacterized protein n=1 Tax=Wickerhamomyces pijperi TaxID=599730 RepID=A0A9P8QBQ9_WICPI|nr:hypothetical protein WICPIJ_000883 [Wickerhamomyces pijperi]
MSVFGASDLTLNCNNSKSLDLLTPHVRSMDLRGFKLVSPSRFLVSTKHFLSSSDVERMIKSAGHSSLLCNLTISPTLRSFQECLANLNFFDCCCC